MASGINAVTENQLRQSTALRSAKGTEKIGSQFQVNSNGDGESSGQGGNVQYRYLTVREGDYVCTYVVIGRNFKVLLGKVKKKDEGEEDEKQQGVEKTNQKATEKNQPTDPKSEGTKEKGAASPTAPEEVNPIQSPNLLNAQIYWNYRQLLAAMKNGDEMVTPAAKAQ